MKGINSSSVLTNYENLLHGTVDYPIINGLSICPAPIIYARLS